MESIKIMRLLRSFDRRNLFLDLDAFDIVEGADSNSEIGWFKFIGSVLTGIYHFNNELLFLYDKASIPLDALTSAKVFPVEGDTYNFTLSIESTIVLDFLYEFNQEILCEAYDTTGFLEREDFDWGLFLSHIVNDKARQKRMLINQKG
ncbi:MAG: hypothetical protein AAGG75_02490 [Bacteroidota bacterium]